MATIAKLVVDLSMNDEMSSKLDTARKNLDSWGKSFRRTGGLMAAAVTAPLVAAGFKVLQLAGNYEQAVGKTGAVFGASANSMLDWSKTSAKAFGLTNTEALAFSSTMGALFRVMDFSQPIAAQMSQELVQLSGDMAAFNDISTSRASEAIIAGLSGEYMSLRSMGVFLNEASVNQEALNIAMADGRDEITESDKVLARYNLIMEQTTQQQGQFARESTGLSGRMAILRARILNIATAFGVRMIPMANKVQAIASKLLDRFDGLSDGTKDLILVIAGLAAAMGPLLIVIGMLLPGISALLGVIGFLLSPIGLVVAAVALLAWVFRDELGAAVGWIVEKFRELKTVFDEYLAISGDPMLAALGALQKVFPALTEVVGHLRDALNAFRAGDYAGMFAALLGAIQAGVNAAADAITNRFPALRPIFNAVAIAVGWVVDAITGLVNMAIDFGAQESTINAFKATWAFLESAIRWVISAISEIVGHVIDFSTHETTIATFQAVWDALKVAVEAIVPSIAELVKFAFDFATSEAVVNAYKAVWNSLKEVISAITDDIAAVVKYVIDFSTSETTINTFKTVWDNLKTAISAIQTAIDTVTALVPDFSSITGPIDSIITKLQTAIELWNQFSGLFGGGGGINEESGYQSDPETGFVREKPGVPGGGGGGYEMPAFASSNFTQMLAGLQSLKDRMVETKATFDSSIPPIGTGFATASSWPAAPLAALASIKGGFSGTLPTVASLTQSNFDRAKSSAISSSESMRSSVVKSIGDMSSSAISTVGAMALKLIDRASNMTSAVKTEFMNMNTAAATQTSIMNTIVGAAFTTMTTRTVSAMASMRSAVSSGMSAVVASVSSGMSAAASAAAGMSGRFHGAGADAIQGLVNGAASRLGALQNVVSQAIAIMSRIPALGNSPWPMMIGAGHDAMDGLVIGIDDRRSRLNRAIDGVIDDFAGANPSLSGSIHGAGQGGQVVNVYYSVTPEELRKLIQDAEDGGAFARNLGKELALEMGMA